MIKEERKKKKRRKSILKYIAIVIIILAILGLVAVKLFTVKEVEVEGNKLYDNMVIQEAVLNDEYSWNSLYVFLKYKFLKTEDVPFIDEMTVSLKGPHTLHIEVYEKGMMGYLYINGIGENAYFDKDGFVVETSSDVIAGVPEIRGIECDQVVLYEKLPVDSDVLRSILNLTQTLKRYELVPDSIRYGVENEPVVKYKKLKVPIGDTTNLTKKVMRLSAIIDSVRDRSGTLHLEDWTEENTNIVFDPD